MNPRLSSKPSAAKSGRTFLTARQLLLAALAITPAASAQLNGAGEPASPPNTLPLEPRAPHQKNRLGLSARFGFNLSAEFRNVGGPVSNPGPDPIQDPAFAGMRQDHDGFVGPDATYPNNNGFTANWGYDRASQVQGTEIFYHSASPASGTGGNATPDQVPLGFELTYARELQRNAYGSWGVEIGAGWNSLCIRDQSTLQGQANVLQDAYFLGSPPPTLPNPPFAGTPTGTDYAAIHDTPTRTTGPVAGTVTGQRNLDADLYLFRLGPYLDYRLTRKISVQAGVGVAAVVTDSEFSFAEATTTAVGTIQRNGYSSETDVRFGPYLMGQVITALTDRVQIFAGVQFYMLGETSLTAGSKQAVLKLDESLFVHAGLGFSF